MHNVFCAHSVKSRPSSQWELLYTGTGAGHLENVSALAEEFAARFGAADWGRLAGLWHDIGKYSASFQDYLLTASGLEAHLEQTSKVHHMTAGAQHAAATIPTCERLLAYLIAGPHADLADAFGTSASLEQRLTKSVEPYSAAPAELLAPHVALGVPPLDFDQNDPSIAAFQLALFNRLLFSCLVDADFFAPERFMIPQRTAPRPAQHPSRISKCQRLHRLSTGVIICFRRLTRRVTGVATNWRKQDHLPCPSAAKARKRRRLC